MAIYAIRDQRIVIGSGRGCSANSEIKIVTFNFTKYGLFNAEVVDIGNDAVEGQQAGAI